MILRNNPSLFKYIALHRYRFKCENGVGGGKEAESKGPPQSISSTSSKRLNSSGTVEVWKGQASE